MTWKDHDTLKMLIQKIEDDLMLDKKEIQEALLILMKQAWQDGLE